MPGASSSSMGSGGDVGILGGGGSGPPANISSRDIAVSASPSLGGPPSAGASPSYKHGNGFKIYLTYEALKTDAGSKCVYLNSISSVFSNRIKTGACVLDLHAFDIHLSVKSVLTAGGGGGGGGGGVGGLGGIFFGIGGRLKLKTVIVKFFSSNDFVVLLLVSAA